MTTKLGSGLSTPNRIYIYTYSPLLPFKLFLFIQGICISKKKGFCIPGGLALLEIQALIHAVD